MRAPPALLERVFDASSHAIGAREAGEDGLWRRMTPASTCSGAQPPPLLSRVEIIRAVAPRLLSLLALSDGPGSQTAVSPPTSWTIRLDEHAVSRAEKHARALFALFPLQPSIVVRSLRLPIALSLSPPFRILSLSLSLTHASLLPLLLQIQHRSQPQLPGSGKKEKQQKNTDKQPWRTRRAPCAPASS